MSSKVWDDIICCTIEVWEWISNFIPRFEWMYLLIHVGIKVHVSKRDPIGTNETRKKTCLTLYSAFSCWWPEIFGHLQSVMDNSEPVSMTLEWLCNCLLLAYLILPWKHLVKSVMWDESHRQFWMSYSTWDSRLSNCIHIMTSSNFRVTGPLWGEFTGHRWIPLTMASEAEFDIFYLHLNKRLRKQSWGWSFETQSGSLWRHCNYQLVTRCLQGP